MMKVDDLVKGSWSMKKAGSMKEIGPVMRGKEKDMRNMTTQTSMLATFPEIRPTEKAFTHGLTENTTKETGTMVRNMATGNGKAKTAKLMKETG